MRIYTSDDFITVTMATKEADVIAASIARDIENDPEHKSNVVLVNFSLALRSVSNLLNM